MKILSLLAIVIAVVAWIFAGIMGTNVLSGPFEDRTCLTDCVKNYYHISLGAAVLALILSLLATFKSGLNVINGLALLLSLSLCGIFGFLFIAGNFL